MLAGRVDGPGPSSACKPMAPYTLKEASAIDQLDAIVDVIWTAQSRPYMPSKTINFPQFTTIGQAKADAKQRLWRDHLEGSPQDRWIYIEENATGDVVAATHYERHDGTAFPEGIPHARVDWWPEGEARRFCETIYEQILQPRALWMRRPNGGVCHMVVHPNHRNRGLGGMMMKWVNERLDEEGIEGFMEASELGKALYEKWGYRTVMKLDFYMPPDVPDEWMKLEHDLKMPPWYALWRPPRGVIEPGQRTRPWQAVAALKKPPASGKVIIYT